MEEKYDLFHLTIYKEFRMRHLLDKLTDVAAIPGDESILKDGLATFTEQIGFTGYAYMNIH